MATKIVVTGHQGYIGSEIFFTLKAMGLHPIGIDLKDGKDVNKDMPKNDLVIHCAATLSGKNIYKENVEMMHAIIRSTKKILFLSSAAVYGNNIYATESDILSPINDYGKSKVVCENKIWASKKPSVIFRLSNVYSLHAQHGVFAKFLNGYRTIYGDGKQVRDFVRLEDVVSCVIDATVGTGCDEWRGTYNISSGKGISINALYKRFFSGKPSYLPKRKEIQYSVLDNFRVRCEKNKKFITL